jgi:hypothetical protein
MSDDDIVEKIRKKYERLSGVLDERSRRVWASAEADALGYGGQSIVAKWLKSKALEGGATTTCRPNWT